MFFDTKKEFLVCFKYISTKKEKADKGTEELQAQNQYKKTFPGKKNPDDCNLLLGGSMEGGMETGI